MTVTVTLQSQELGWTTVTLQSQELGWTLVLPGWQVINAHTLAHQRPAVVHVQQFHSLDRHHGAGLSSGREFDLLPWRTRAGQKLLLGLRLCGMCWNHFYPSLQISFHSQHSSWWHA
jgi:hypothetical protein